MIFVMAMAIVMGATYRPKIHEKLGTGEGPINHVNVRTTRDMIMFTEGKSRFTVDIDAAGYVCYIDFTIKEQPATHCYKAIGGPTIP